ncbi:MAG: hypothetical protein ACLSGK_12510 [Lachnospiraceae bacterium]
MNTILSFQLSYRIVKINAKEVSYSLSNSNLAGNKAIFFPKYRYKRQNPRKSGGFFHSSLLLNTSLNTFFTMSTQEITIPTTVITTIDTVFAASALTYLVTPYVINTIINNMSKRKQIFF